MGTITRSLSNNITTGGVILPAGITNASVADVTSFANASGGTLVLLSTQTASSSANISFTTGLDSTYDEYIFKFINIHPANNNVYFRVNASTNGGSSYGVTSTTTFFRAFHDEGDTATSFAYFASADQAQSTDAIFISTEVSNVSDNSVSGELTLFNPSSTTYVKHFISRNNSIFNNNYTMDDFSAGYFNTTSAINAVQFTFITGNIDDGIIKMYGVKKS